MGSVNKVILIGNLGRDAEVRVSKSGTSIATFSIATTERFTDRSGAKKEQTEWHNVTIFGNVVDAISQYLTKGRSVFVEGRLQTDEYQAKDGTKKRQTKVIASRVVLLGGRSDGGARRQDDRQVDQGDDGDGSAEDIGGGEDGFGL